MFALLSQWKSCLRTPNKPTKLKSPFSQDSDTCTTPHTNCCSNDRVLFYVYRLSESATAPLGWIGSRGEQGIWLSTPSILPGSLPDTMLQRATAVTHKYGFKNNNSRIINITLIIFVFLEHAFKCFFASTVRWSSLAYFFLYFSLSETQLHLKMSVSSWSS